MVSVVPENHILQAAARGREQACVPMRRERPGSAGALGSLRSRLLLGLLDFFLVGNALVPAGAGIQGSGGAIVAITRTDAFARIGATVGTCRAVMAESAMSFVGVCRAPVVAVGKCCRDYEEACKDGTDQQLAMERLATRGSAHGRFLDNVKAI
ncbi:MAG TPA: hypothetical protein VGT79_06565, partial [Xanthomonadaceae bacterium]|nr:hypothetical protein [Xanthomonadaceae bacterium]